MRDKPGLLRNNRRSARKPAVGARFQLLVRYRRETSCPFVLGTYSRRFPECQPVSPITHRLALSLVVMYGPEPRPSQVLR